MKLMQFYLSSAETLCYGAVENETVYNLAQLPGAPETLQGLLELSEEKRGDILRNYKNAPAADLSSVRVAPAVTAPQKILCIGLNYRAHAAEAGEKLPDFPEVFSKFNNALAADGEAIPVSPMAGKIDYEAELVAVIGKTCRNASEEEAAEAIFGFTCGNDISAREQQLRVSQWLTGKTQDKFAPVGPWIVTADEFGDLRRLSLDIRLYRGEEVCQSSNTSKMIFPIPQIVSYLSNYMTLCPGDIIFTGTPEGVILGREDKNWLKSGETLTVEIQNIGRLTNTIA